MARMRVVSLNRWGEEGIQVSFELNPPILGRAVSYTIMASPESAADYNRLLNMKLYEEYDVDEEKITPVS